MLREIFYASGLIVNIGIIYILYDKYVSNEKVLVKDRKREEIVEKEEENKEEKIKERLKVIGGHKYLGLRNWINYIPSLVSKNQ